MASLLLFHICSPRRWQRHQIKTPAWPQEGTVCDHSPTAASPVRQRASPAGAGKGLLSTSPARLSYLARSTANSGGGSCHSSPGLAGLHARLLRHRHRERTAPAALGKVIGLSISQRPSGRQEAGGEAPGPEWGGNSGSHPTPYSSSKGVAGVHPSRQLQGRLSGPSRLSRPSRSR